MGSADAGESGMIIGSESDVNSTDPGFSISYRLAWDPASRWLIALHRDRILVSVNSAFKIL